jgi:hypothetical protein
MDNVKFQDFEFMGVTTTYAIIENADGSQVTMPKSTYDELKANEAKII